MNEHVIPRWRGWGIAILFGFLPLCAHAEKAIQLRDGVLIDAGAQRVILMAADGGVEAVGLNDGRVQWQQAGAARPLYSFGQAIWAQAPPRHPEGDLSIVTLNVDGELTNHARVQVPSRAWTSVDDGLGRTFRIAAEGEDAAPRFRWRSEERLIKGALATITPPPEAPGSDPRMRSLPPESLKVEEGRFDLSTGQVRALPKDGNRPWPTTVARVRPSKPSEPGERHYLSADGNHLLVSSKVADNRQWHRYRWRLFDHRSGALLGEIENHVAWAPFVVVRQTLLFEERPWARQQGGELVSSPLQLIVIDLSTDDELWRREIRDTTYHGPFPS